WGDSVLVFPGLRLSGEPRSTPAHADRLTHTSFNLPPGSPGSSHSAGLNRRLNCTAVGQNSTPPLTRDKWKILIPCFDSPILKITAAPAPQGARRACCPRTGLKSRRDRGASCEVSCLCELLSSPCQGLLHRPPAAFHFQGCWRWPAGVAGLKKGQSLKGRIRGFPSGPSGQRSHQPPYC